MRADVVVLGGGVVVEVFGDGLQSGPAGAAHVVLGVGVGEQATKGGIAAVADARGTGSGDVRGVGGPELVDDGLELVQDQGLIDQVLRLGLEGFRVAPDDAQGLAGWAIFARAVRVCRIA